MFRARIKFDKFAQVEIKTLAGADKAVRAAAIAILEEAQANVRSVGAIDTGAMLNSIYVETSKTAGSERAQAVAKAVSAGGKPGIKSKKPAKPSMAIPTPIPAKPGQAKVAVAVEYGVYIEMGVKASKTGDHPPRPFLHPAVETVRREIPQIVAAIVKEELGGKL